MKPIVIISLALVMGCSALQQGADELARDRAKLSVNAAVADRFPGVNAAPVTDCVIDNASAQEILSLAEASITASATGVTDRTVSLVTDIVRRPETLRCLATNAISLL